jgi:ketosteroid isomerase-like protein
MRSRRRHILATGVALSLAPFTLAAADTPAAGAARPAAAPTEESALATDQRFAQAMQDNDAAGIEGVLADDWAVIPSDGGLGEGKSIFPDGIRTGVLTRTTYELSEPRVRLYGNVAVVTSKVHNAGTFHGKPYDVLMRQTDVMQWQAGTWKVVLTAEAVIKHLV